MTLRGRRRCVPVSLAERTVAPGGGVKGELVGELGSGLSRGVEVSVTSSRSSVFEAAYLGHDYLTIARFLT